MTKVFISHKKEDVKEALAVCTVLKGNGIQYYLDELDPSIENDGSRLSQHIRNHLSRCSHLLAVLSEKTKASWWVPFEIGIATEKEHTIANYLVTQVNLPGYLQAWPRLKNNNDLELYCKHILQMQSVILEKSAAAYQKPVNYADAFHKTLKRSLGQ